MFIEFDQNSQPEIFFTNVYQPGEIDLNEETVQLVSELKLEGIARRSGQTAQLEGHLKTEAEILCDRCLEALRIALVSSFKIDYVTLDVYESTQDEAELTEKDMSLSIYDGERIDLDDVAREQLLLNFPSHTLCKEDCAGLCLKCGTNKNINSCFCEVEEIDPRWEALKKIKS